VKAGWTSKPIGDVFKVVNGGTPKTGIASNWDGPHAWITPAEMGNLDTPYISESRRTLTDEGLRTGAELVPAKSIILSSRAPIGHLVINEIPMAFNQGCKGLIPSPAIDTKYAYYFLLTNVPLLESLGTGATFKELSGGKLKEVQFQFPALSEQHRIVTLLDEAFADIATAKANAEKNLQNARSIFQTHLDSFFESNSNKKQEKLLMDALADQPRNGWSPPAANHSDTGTPVLTLSAVTGFKFRPEKIKHTSAPTNTDLHYWVVNGDLLLTRSNTPELVGHVAVVSDITQPTIYPDLIMRMNADPHKAINRFLYYQLRSTKLRRIIMSRAHGANPTMKKVGKNDVQTLPIWLPSLDEQQKITGELEELEASSVNLGTIYRQKLTALDDLKKSLLHQAFSGQL
jgi:type I restriction enzyme S subunit